jgi:hypothetical protein
MVRTPYDCVVTVVTRMRWFGATDGGAGVIAATTGLAPTDCSETLVAGLELTTPAMTVTGSRTRRNNVAIRRQEELFNFLTRRRWNEPRDFWLNAILLLPRLNASVFIYLEKDVFSCNTRTL